jgi:hypothetical protein
MAIAKVTDKLNAQPQAADILDQRERAGVSAYNVGTESIDDEAITLAKMGLLSVGSGQLIDKSTTFAKLGTDILRGIIDAS